MDTQLTVRFGLETALLSQEEVHGNTVCNECISETWRWLAQHELDEPSQRAVDQRVHCWVTNW